MTEQTVRRAAGVRRATVADAPELVRLRVVMLTSMGANVSEMGPGWRDQATAGPTLALEPGWPVRLRRQRVH